MSATRTATARVRRARRAMAAARRGAFGVVAIALLSAALAAVPGSRPTGSVDAAADLCTLLPAGYTGEPWRGKHWPAAAEACRATYHAGTWEMSVDIERFDRAPDAWDLMGATPTGGAALQAAFHLGDTSVVQADPGAAPGINRWVIFLRGGPAGCYVVTGTFGDAVQEQAREVLSQVDQKLAGNAPCPRPPAGSARAATSSGSEGAGTGAPLAGTLAAVVAGLLAGALGAALAAASGSTIGSSAAAAGDVPTATSSAGADDSGSDSGQAAGADGGVHAPLANGPLEGSDAMPGADGAEPPPDEPSDDLPPVVDSHAGIVDGPGDLPQVEPGDPGGDWAGWIRAPSTESVLNASGESSPDDGALVAVVKTTTLDEAPDEAPDDEPDDESTADTAPEDTTDSEDPMDGDEPGDDDGSTTTDDSTAAKTPEEVHAENTAKRDRYRRLIATATAAVDSEVAARLQTFLRQHANKDARGVPQGDLQALERVVNGMLTQPPGSVEEFRRLAGDFFRGVRGDVGQVAGDAIDAGKRLGTAIKDAGTATVQGVAQFASDPALRHEFWNVTRENVGRGVDRAIEKGSEIGSDFTRTAGDLGRGIGDLLTDPAFRKEFVDVTTENIARGLEQLKSGATDTLRTAADAQFWTEALGGFIGDLQDPEKVAQAFRDGVPGGKQILDAMDPSKGSVTERLVNAFAGAAEWAGTADLLHSGLELGGAAAAEDAAATSRAEMIARQEQAAAERAPVIDANRYQPANLSPEQLQEWLAGMPERNQRDVQVIADKYGVEIQVRPTNADARALLESGEGYPKPESIKMKTINDLDTQLGAPADGAGKVGYFEPRLPDGYSSPGELPDDLRRRFDQRMQEYVDRKAEVDRMLTTPDASHGERLIEVRDGVVYDTSTGKPFCGDHDLFDIRGLNGEELPKAARDRVVKDLSDVPAQVQHGDHMSWDYGGKSRTPPPPTIDESTGQLIQPRSDYEQAQGIDQKILAGHGPPRVVDGQTVGGEPLITFRGGEGTAPVGDRLGSSYYTGGGGRPIRLSPEDKLQLKRWGLAERDLQKMTPEQVYRMFGKPIAP